MKGIAREEGPHVDDEDISCCMYYRLPPGLCRNVPHRRDQIYQVWQVVQIPSSMSEDSYLACEEQTRGSQAKPRQYRSAMSMKLWNSVLSRQHGTGVRTRD